MDVSIIIRLLGPELLIALAGLAGVILGSVLKTRFDRASVYLGSLVLAAAGLLSLMRPETGEAFNGLWRVSHVTNIAAALTYFCAATALSLGQGFLIKEKLIRFEYSLLVLFATCGLGVMLGANDLMTLYLGIEMFGLSSYVLAAFHRDGLRSSEAGLKYFVLGAIASGILLYGASLIYGFVGSTNFDEIAGRSIDIGGLFGFVLLVIGLAFKMSAAPLHIWTPDVYEGAPTPVVAFFASASKIAVVIVFAFVLHSVFGAVFEQSRDIVILIAGASMLVGAFGGLAQTNLKRLFAYSTIGNMGYVLIAFAAGKAIGEYPILIYMGIYGITQLGLFGLLLSMRTSTGMVEKISDLSGLSQTKPMLAICTTILVASVAGIPPFGGFFGKFIVFQAGIEAELFPLVLIGVVASVISLGYYLRILMVIWGGDPKPKFEKPTSFASMTINVTTLFMFPVIPVFAGWLFTLASSGPLALPL